MPKTFKCDICNKKFNDKYQLVSHKHVHSTDTPYSCPQCPYRGKTKKYLSRHTRQVHNKRTGEHKCSVCGKLFLNPSNLKVHAMVHSGEKPHCCKICGKTFRVTYSLNSHMLIHTNEKPFQCSFCDYACRDSSTLRKHQYKHMGLEKIYECTICDKRCKSKMALKIHISESHLDVDVRKFSCTYCDRKFKSHANRNMHINSIHKRALTCNCPICGRRLTNKHNLTSHMRTHLDERPFKCTHPKCKLAFKDKNSLRKHTVIHDPKLHYPCKYCGHKFARKAHVTRHERVMHLERRRTVECDYCGSKFYSKNYLIKHIQTKHVHKQSFKYICDMCGFVTHNKPSIVMHIKYGHSNDHDMQCKICDTHVVYKRHLYLKLHYWNSHNVRYKITKKPSRFKKEVKKRLTAVEIKVEPIEAESYEGLQLLEVDKMEVEDTFDESLDYSKRVLSEDIAESVLSKREHNKEVDFDEFFIRHVFTKTESKATISDENYDIDEEQNENVKKRIKEILMNTQKLEKAKALRKKRKKEEIEKKRREKEEAKLRVEKEKLELIELRRVREMYNARMKDALAKEKVKLDQLKHEQVKIKYFKKKSEENDKSQENPMEIDVAESLIDGKLVGNESDDENIVNNLNGDDGEDPVENLKSDKVFNDNVLIEKSEDSNNIDDIPSCDNETNDISENHDIEHDNHLIKDINKDHTHQDTDNLNIHSEGNSTNDSNDKTENYNRKQNIDKLEHETTIEDTENDNIDKLEHETTIEDTENDNIEQDNHINNNKTDSRNHRTSNDNIDDVNGILEHNKNNIIEDNNKNNGGVQKHDQNDILNKKIVEHCNTITEDEDFDQPLLKRRVQTRKSVRKRCQNDGDGKNDKDEENASDEEVIGKAKRMDFKTFQCYICFKLFQTKQALVDHCQDHFDICHERTLTKCPICNYVSHKGIAEHMKKKHNLTVKIPFNKIKNRKTEDGSKYCYDVDGTIVEVIPSVVILNKIASDQIDKKRRDVKDKSIAKSKLVKKGDDWIVEKEAIDIEYDEIPELSDKELNKCKITDNDVDRLGQLNYLIRKKGLKMMFPCFKCDKICQNFSALKLHKRRHEDNPKPFKPRVYKRNKVEHKKIKLNKSNRTALPRPIKNKHKCDEKLKEFFETNIRGKDIEFWQFLKIFNKMDREQVNDFHDLEKRSDFGNHLDYYKDVSDNEDEIDEDASRNVVKTKNN